jgi:hypothetical protein
LLPGCLQLAAGTGLLLDETTMASGVLNDAGVKNVRVLSRVLQEQILQYDFVYHTPLDFNVDIPCVVVSKGKSILPCDLQIAVTEDGFPEQLPQPSEEMLSAWRKYLLLARQLPFELSDTSGMVSNSFVALRKEDARMNAASFHVLLTLTRLLAVSYLDVELSAARWDETLQLWREIQPPR